MKKLLLALIAMTTMVAPSISSSQSQVAIVKRAASDYADINPSYPSEFGDMVNEFEHGNYFYRNFVRGYVRAEKSGSSYIYKVVASKNFNQDGTESFVDLNLMLEYVANIINTSPYSGDSITKVLGTRITTEEVEEIRAKYKAKYSELYNAGFNVGIKNSDVKSWDNYYITQDFTNGDGTFSFGTDRVNMSFLMYNKDTKEVYLLTNKQADIWNSHKEELGSPKSDLFTINTTIPGSSKAIDTNLQVFDKGFIYGSGASYSYVSGYEYDFQNNTFKAIPNPITSSHYGNLLKTIERENGTITLAYEYGTINCNTSGSSYTYEYLPGRILNADEKTYTWIPLATCLTWVGDEIDSNYGTQVANIAALLKAKYTELYNAGYFCGFKTSGFDANWNGINAQQFVNSDSTANPWEGTRTNVSALVYVESTNKVVLLKDNCLLLWNKSWSNYGSPIEDSFTDSEGTVYQQFENGLLVLVQNQADLSFFYDGTYDDYVAGKDGYDRPTPGMEYNIPDTTTPIVIGVAVPSVVVLVGLVVIMVLLKKKKAKTEIEE